MSVKRNVIAKINVAAGAKILITQKSNSAILYAITLLIITNHT